MERFHTNSYTRINADGTIKTYSYKRKYVPHKRQTKLSETQKIRIQELHNSGVTKKRLMTDYSISFPTLQKALIVTENIVTSA